jgi:hypothetical protein
VHPAPLLSSLTARLTVRLMLVFALPSCSALPFPGRIVRRVQRDCGGRMTAAAQIIARSIVEQRESPSSMRLRKM